MKNTIRRIVTAVSIIALAFVFFSNLGAVKSIASKLKAKTACSVVYPSAMEIETAMMTAHAAAYRYASKEIDSWIDELMYRVDNAFLCDYFSFVQVKKREITSLFYSIRHFFSSDSETAEKIITRELERKLSDIVIKPEQSQLRINEITKGAVGVYMETFGSELARLQIEYKIPAPEWNKYISDICGLTLDVNQKAYPVKFKMAVVSGTALSLVSVAPVVKKIASTASKKMAARAGAKAGAKIVGKVAAKAGVQVAGRGAAAAHRRGRGDRKRSGQRGHRPGLPGGASGRMRRGAKAPKIRERIQGRSLDAFSFWIRRPSPPQAGWPRGILRCSEAFPPRSTPIPGPGRSGRPGRRTPPPPAAVLPCRGGESSGCRTGSPSAPPPRPPPWRRRRPPCRRRKRAARRGQSRRDCRNAPSPGSPRCSGRAPGPGSRCRCGCCSCSGRSVLQWSWGSLLAFDVESFLQYTILEEKTQPERKNG